MRTCDRCGKPSKGLQARKRVGDELLCKLCATLEVLGGLLDNEDLSKEGHQARENDELQVYHCPFCGSGQVTGRSDGDIICDFCDKSFIVSVQPMVSAIPQTVEGEEFEAPTEDDIEEEEEEKIEGKEASYYLAERRSGVNTVLDEDSYIRHLAMKYADNKASVVGAVRASRRP